MEIFAGLGLAVGGIFATIVFAGILAGIIAFGLMDLGIRALIHRTVVNQKIDERVARLDPKYYPMFVEILWGLDLPESEELRSLARHGDAVPKLLHMTPHQFFGLHYRQLCGQIAARINREMMSQEDPYRYRGPITALFALANVTTPDETPFAMHEEQFRPDDRALAAVDTLQIDLGNAVIRTAKWLAGGIVALLFVALYIPTASRMAFFADSSEAMFRAAGGVLAALVSLLLLVAFAFGAVVIAALTFRWIDRLASPR
jgi:hypothetical protein